MTFEETIKAKIENARNELKRQFDKVFLSREITVEEYLVKSNQLQGEIEAYEDSLNLYKQSVEVKAKKILKEKRVKVDVLFLVKTYKEYNYFILIEERQLTYEEYIILQEYFQGDK